MRNAQLFSGMSECLLPGLLIICNEFTREFPVNFRKLQWILGVPLANYILYELIGFDVINLLYLQWACYCVLEGMSWLWVIGNYLRGLTQLLRFISCNYGILHNLFENMFDLWLIKLFCAHLSFKTYQNILKVSS